MEPLVTKQGTIKTATDVVQISLPDQPNVAVAISGTHAGINMTFETSVDGVNWDGCVAVRQATGGLETTSGVITSNATRIWQVYVGAAVYFRVRATAYTSGTGNIMLLSSDEGVPTVVSALLATGAVTIGNIGTIATSVTPGVAAANLGKAEDAAHASGDTGVPDWGVRYEALTAPASAAADYTIKTHDDLGKYVTMPYAPPINHVQGITAAMTGTASTSVIASAGASVRNYITNLTLTNTHATVGTEIQILDGSTVLDRIYVPALTTISKAYAVPLKGTAATAVNAQNVTTGSNTYVQATGFKAL